MMCLQYLYAIYRNSRLNHQLMNSLIQLRKKEDLCPDPRRRKLHKNNRIFVTQSQHLPRKKKMSLSTGIATIVNNANLVLFCLRVTTPLICMEVPSLHVRLSTISLCTTQTCLTLLLIPTSHLNLNSWIRIRASLSKRIINALGNSVHFACKAIMIKNSRMLLKIKTGCVLSAKECANALGAADKTN